MLNKEDSRRLAQLERQLWRDDPDFCARMTISDSARKRIPLTVVFAAMVIWTAALVLGVMGWWIAAAIAAVGATAVVAAIIYRCRPAKAGRAPTPPTTW